MFKDIDFIRFAAHNMVILPPTCISIQCMKRNKLCSRNDLHDRTLKVKVGSFYLSFFSRQSTVVLLQLKEWMFVRVHYSARCVLTPLKNCN